MPTENQNTAHERPMLFHGEVVRAVLEGRKMVTRRTTRTLDSTLLTGLAEKT